MTEKPPPRAASKPRTKPSREDRLAEALRANLKRRKSAPENREIERGGAAAPPGTDERDD
jgi:hypothetical protein